MHLSVCSVQHKPVFSKSPAAPAAVISTVKPLLCQTCRHLKSAKTSHPRWRSFCSSYCNQGIYLRDSQETRLKRQTRVAQRWDFTWRRPKPARPRGGWALASGIWREELASVWDAAKASQHCPRVLGVKSTARRRAPLEPLGDPGRAEGRGRGGLSSP